MNWLRSIILFVLLSGFSACAKLVEVGPPPTALTSDNIYSDDATATSVFAGIYTTIQLTPASGAGTIGSVSITAGLSADELTLFGGTSNQNSVLGQYYSNNLNAGSTTATLAGSFWGTFYNAANIYTVNIALEKLEASTSLTPSVRQQLMGEAKFLRAFFYFYLVNFYGDVPLTTTSDYRVNAVLSRTGHSLVYQQIINDLQSAKDLMSDGYVGSDSKSSTQERIRPNRWAAMALLARAYLYAGKNDSAEQAATAVINNTALYDTVSLNGAFKKNTKEAIWQLQPVNTGWNTEDGRVFILPASGPTTNTSSNYPVILSPQILSAFEPGDQRRVNWVDSVIVGGTTYFFPYKYKSATLNDPVTEYTMVLRISEQYLIRAEARANQNNISGAQSDLNLIRKKAGLPPTPANDQGSLSTVIQHERQVELFTEWGHRWLDLKRTNTVDQTMTNVTPMKGGNWSPNWQWYPIPAYDIFQDPNITQNNGY